MSDYGVKIGIKADTGIMLSKPSTVSAVVKSLPLTHIYITAYLPGLVQTLQYKVVGLN